MFYRSLLSIFALLVLVSCQSAQRSPLQSSPLELSHRDKLNLSLGLTGGFVQSCASDIQNLAPNRTALFHFLSHADDQGSYDPFMRVVVFDVPDLYNRTVKIVANYEDLQVLSQIFSEQSITDVYSVVAAPYDPETVDDEKRYEVIFTNARKLMEKMPMKCVKEIPDFSLPVSGQSN